MTSPLDLDALQKLAEAATPGPWGDASAGWGGAVWSGPVVVDDAGSVSAIGSNTFNICDMNVDSYHELEQFEDEEEAVSQSEADAAFIAAANPQTVLALIAAAREHARLVSALEFLDRREGTPNGGLSFGDKTVQAILARATTFGWRFPEGGSGANQEG